MEIILYTGDKISPYSNYPGAQTSSCLLNLISPLS